MGIHITLRMRLECTIKRRGDKHPSKTVEVLNEIVIDRGSNPYLTKIECWEHNSLITKVPASQHTNCTLCCCTSCSFKVHTARQPHYRGAACHLVVIQDDDHDGASRLAATLLTRTEFWGHHSLIMQVDP